MPARPFVYSVCRLVLCGALCLLLPRTALGEEDALDLVGQDLASSNPPSELLAE